MLYVIIILDPGYETYRDIVVMYLDVFDKEGKQYVCTTYYEASMQGLLKNDSETQCIFFGTRCHQFKIPKNSIITNYDNDSVIHQIITEDLARDNIILNYSEFCNEKLKQLYKFPLRLGLCYYGYSSRHDNYKFVPKEYDLCYFGSGEMRRQQILNVLATKYKCCFGHGFWAEQRTDIFNKSKIVLSIYSSDYITKFTYGSRIFPAVSNGSLVIAERCKDEKVAVELDKICINVDYNSLIPTIDYFLQHPELCATLAKQFHENVKNINASLYIKV